MLTKEEMPACPVATTVQLIGSKWKLLIMRNLLQRPWRFNELRKNLEGISQKVLTDMPQLYGRGRHHYPNGLSRSSAPRGVCLECVGRMHAAYHGRDGSVGKQLQKTRDEKKPGYPPLPVGTSGLFRFYELAARGKAVRRKGVDKSNCN